MFTPRIYFPSPLNIGEKIYFDEKVSHYVSHVLRLKTGDPIIVFNGLGGEYSAEITFEKKKVFFSPIKFHDHTRTSHLQLHVGQAISRGDRMDFAIQKATELGVNSITPLLSQFCAVKLNESRGEKRILHWQNIAISAAEQSGRTDIPTIHTPVTLKEWVKESFAGTSILFDIGPYASLKTLHCTQAIRIAIGPESGWAEEEHKFMAENNFQTCSLGPRILRTETACMAAVALVQGLFGDLS